MLYFAMKEDSEKCFFLKLRGKMVFCATLGWERCRKGDVSGLGASLVCICTKLWRQLELHILLRSLSATR